MHVTRVELDNIKSYEREAFDFQRGTTAIVGPNGAGKTTILEAIAWALFDVLDYPKDDFLRRGAKKGSVRVTFESDSDGRSYTVYRDTGNGYYVHDPGLNAKVAEKKHDVSALLRQLLGIEPGTDIPALFKSAIGVPQGTLTADFLKPASQRKAAFDRLLKVEEYREGADKLLRVERLIGERTADVRERIGQAQGQLASYDRLVAELAETAARAAELEETVETLRREAEERARSVAALDEAERRVSETRARAERTTIERDAAERRARELRGELEAARSARERQRATAADFAAHNGALELIGALELERRERDRTQALAHEAERLSSAAERDVRRIEDALERSVRARLALAELEPEINAQEDLERERERLRDLLAQARAAREQVARLDRELDDLRAQHAQVRERVRAAESAAGAQAEVERLESERLGVETELSSVEKKIAERNILVKQRRDQARETQRLRGSVEKLEREAREFEARAVGSERAAELESRERELAAEAARLRAQIEQDERVREQVKGGVCPILADRCTSFTEGRNFEFYFGDSIKTNRAALKRVETEGAKVSREVVGARAAQTAAAQLQRERERLARERAQLSDQESRLAATENHLAELATATDELHDTLRARLTGVDAVLKSTREAARRFAELAPLRARLEEIVEEGKRRREERDERSAAANAADALEQELTENDAALRRLRDPRGRAAALRDEAAREETLTAELAGARDALAALTGQKREHDAALARYVDLEARWSQAVAERERTAAAFREHIESKSLADLLPAREEAARAAEAALRRATEEADSARADHERATSSYDPARHADERAQLAVVAARVADSAARLEVARGAREKLTAEIAQLDEVSAGLQTEIREQRRLGRLQETTEFMRDTLKKAGPEVTKSYVAHISVEANQLFREITGEAGHTLRWTSDYEIVVEEGGHERSFVSLSGGEQMAAALAVRLALLKQLSDIRIAFFDEPTVNMDAERRERLAQQIGQVRHFDQLFVISHDDTFEETVDHVVMLAARREEEATA
jgi:DNA repair protein SbcC/Rad50